eukprot:2337123-Alexandrium_andersonii.AAC.1
MRQPHASVGRVPRAAEFRDLVRPILLEHLQETPELSSYLLDGTTQPSADPPPGLTPEHLRRVRLKIARALGALDPGDRAGLNETLFGAFAHVAGDP